MLILYISNIISIIDNTTRYNPNNKSTDNTDINRLNNTYDNTDINRLNNTVYNSTN
ncbi:hypothetical protein NEIRO02_2281, partial [Nematocida sp. AWRm79]